jgi:hypothetical protein
VAKKITDDGEIINEVLPHTAVELPAPFWKTPYNYDRDEEAFRTGLACKDKSKTQQQFAKDADINVILAKFLNTGELPSTGAPTYQDVEAEFDLQDQMVTAYQVDEAWNKLPTAVRNILKDPKTFADYVSHCLETGDIDPLRELGLANPLPAAPGSSPATPEPVKASDEA